jgi:hypothetical protein
MREFVTAVAAAEENEDERKESGWVEFEVIEQDQHGKVLRKVPCNARRPSPGQVAYLTGSLHRRAPQEQQIAGAINFCMAIMDHDTSAYLSDRLLDSEDPFDLPDIQNIIEGLLEEWSGKAGEQSSDSSGTPQASGMSTSSS